MPLLEHVPAKVSTCTPLTHSPFPLAGMTRTKMAALVQRWKLHFQGHIADLPTQTASLWTISNKRNINLIHFGVILLK